MRISDLPALSSWILVAGLGIAGTTSTSAQPDAAVSFEAASLKPTAPDTRGSSIDKPGGATFNA
jgi:hypothetical protein